MNPIDIGNDNLSTEKRRTADAPAAAVNGVQQLPELEYVRVQHRRSLYRALATNIVRELLAAGHQAHELLPFASEIVQAITDVGWERESLPEASADLPAPSFKKPLHVAADAQGRPTLTAGGLALRPPTPDDRKALETWEKDPRVRASLIPSVLKAVLSGFDGAGPMDSRVDLVICTDASAPAVGLVSLHDIRNDLRQAELGKIVGDPAFRGRGIAAQATRLLVAYGFEHLGLNRIYLRTFGANVKNIRLNERLGFRFEGILRQAALLDGVPSDVVLMAMLRSEYESMTADVE